MADVTAKILGQIRDELREIRGEVRTTNERVEHTNEKLDLLARRQTETEVRLATEIVALAGDVQDVKALLRARRVDRARVDDHEERIQVLERRRKH